MCLIMSVIVSVHQLSKSFAARPLFNSITFAIESGDRIGLIGPNGAGKSTLLRIIASKTSPDSGQISMQRGLRIGFLEQVPSFSENASILSTILEGSTAPTDWESVANAKEYISKFDLTTFGEEALVGDLSGGWKKRVALARELIRKPDLLLLDEPTNHLDIESILWLENLINRSSFATLTITHDRLFLQRVANRIFELDPRHAGGLLSVNGAYTSYLEIREQMISAQEQKEVILKNTLRRETEWLRQGAKARTTKQQARIQRAEGLKQEVDELTIRNQNRTAKIDFQGNEKNPKKLIEARKISKAYGSKQIFHELDLMITPGTRIGLIGPNGSGKSTLIRVLIGQENPSLGQLFRSEHLSVAYFDQTRDALDPNISLVKTLSPVGDYVEYRGTKTHIRSYLDRFLFSQSQMDMTVGKLSGGEQSRVLIARLMLTPANLLVLDEPTNDLDMATLNVLEDCLTDFGGAVILVTHDRYFLDQVANKILAFDPYTTGKPLIPFADLKQWENWHAAQKKPETAPISEKQDKTIKQAVQKKRKLSFKDQRELDSMESNIHRAEETLAKLVQESALSENSCNAILLAKLTQQMADSQKEIDRLYNRWAELEGK